MATIIGLRELRENTGDVEERVNNGESFVVVKRSKPIFRIVPMAGQTQADDELVRWTSQAMKKYEPALKALADK